MTGKLILCPTPIGNLGDASPRMESALRDADVICAEDTRVTGKLLSALGIEGKRLERLDENVLRSRTEGILQRIREGEVVAYATDAGMPGVSDPGLYLVRAARESGLPVEVLPGPSAAVTAYVASGTLCPQFYFGGFFPRKDAQRQRLLESLAGLDAALIFYESPNRLMGALGAIERTMPLRTVAVCRELTKLHEEVVRGTAQALRDEFGQRSSVKGEIVLVIEGPTEEEAQVAEGQAAEAARQRGRELLAEGLRPKEAARRLVEEFSLSRNDAYDLVLRLRDDLES